MTSWRWRGTIDVPVTKKCRDEIKTDCEGIGHVVKPDLVFHDHLKRCQKTAKWLGKGRMVETEGPRPWRMGPMFEGLEIDEASLAAAMYFVENDLDVPPDGESFFDWSEDWFAFVHYLLDGAFLSFIHRAVIVTHNRNIQALYAQCAPPGCFLNVYDDVGPAPLTIHYMNSWKTGIAPLNWSSRWGCPPDGLYFLRHAPTEWGT